MPAAPKGNQGQTGLRIVLCRWLSTTWRSFREGTGTTGRRLIEITSRQQQTQRTLLDWLRMEYWIEKPSNKLVAATDLDSDTWVSEVKRIRGKKLPLTAALSSLRFPLSAFPISAFGHGRPRPRRRNLATGAHPQRPRQSGLWPNPGGDCANVANRPAPHARPASHTMI
jgi:hypothetical protein